MILAAVLCLMAGCAARPIQKEAFLLDTFVSLTVYGTETAAEDALGLCALYEEQYSRTRSGFVGSVNAADGAAVAATADTTALLQEALTYSALSDGFFDITIGGVSALWDFTSGESAPPGVDTIANALESVGHENIVIDSNMVRLTNGAQLDLGAIAKGYISDCMVESLQASGVDTAVISLGGNIVTVGARPGGKSWEIGVQKPFGAAGELSGVLRFHGGMAVVTTGVYERGFTHDGAYYHHILDPATGYPAVSDLVSVTVLHESGMTADALGTVVFGKGAEEGLAFLNNYPGAEGVLITMDGEILTTAGIGADIQFEGR